MDIAPLFLLTSDFQGKERQAGTELWEGTTLKMGRAIKDLRAASGDIDGLAARLNLWTLENGPK